MKKFSPGPDFTQGDRMRNLNFPDLVAEGENPRGFVAQTANGTAGSLGHGGHNYQWDWERPEAPAEGIRGEVEMSFKGVVVRGGKANRSGE